MLFESEIYLFINIVLQFSVFNARYKCNYFHLLSIITIQIKYLHKAKIITLYIYILDQIIINYT